MSDTPHVDADADANEHDDSADEIEELASLTTSQATPPDSTFSEQIESLRQLLIQNPDLLRKSSTRTAPPETIGRYLIVEELDSGGFGRVFLAHDPLADRAVAIKIPRADRVGPAASANLLMEARAAARLKKHENVVQILDVHDDDADGIYVISEFCEGGSLANWLKRREDPKSVPFRMAARIVAELADGVQYSHEGGVLHRDLKPGNVLLRPAPVGPDGLDMIPMVGDFGLARLGDIDGVGDSAHGTSGYMAPEQTGGQSSLIGPATDVYGLGSVLYVLIAGHAPFQGKVREEVFARIRNEPPTPLRRLRPGTPPDLEAIVLRCLAKDPAARFPSAHAVAEELRKFLAGEPIAKSPWWKYARTWPGRRPIAASVLIAAFVVSVVVPAIRQESNSWQTDRALAELETIQLDSLPRVLAQLDASDPKVITRLNELAQRPDPRLQLAAAIGKAPVSIPDRERAIELWLDRAPNEIAALAQIANDRIPDLPQRLDAEIALKIEPTEDPKVFEARQGRRANAAIAHWLLGRPAPALEMLKHTPNPEARSLLIHRLGPANIAPEVLFDSAKTTSDLSVRRALVLALGEVPRKQWSDATRATLTEWLLDRYRNDPDSGTHGATKWLLWRWIRDKGESVEARENLARQIEVINQDLAGTERDGFTWRISPIGLTMIRVPQPNGSVIEISDTEITVGLYKQFVSNPAYSAGGSFTSDHPINTVTLASGRDFCAWLSKSELVLPDAPYRLPTVREFIRASRAGATTRRFYGFAPSLLGQYAAYSASDDVRASQVGTFKPNDLGFFDTMGNIAELCDHPVDARPPHALAIGASSAHSSPNISCASMDQVVNDTFPMPYNGFRVARTLSTPSH